MDVSVGSELGIWQRHNSDAHASEAIAPHVTFFGVADGFGTMVGGVSAATLAIGAVRDYVRRRQRLGAFGPRVSPSGVRSLLLAAMEYANARLYAQSGSHEDFVAGGTSLTAVLVVGHHAYVGHVGESRAYLLRLGRLEPLTVDDAVFADVVASAKATFAVRPSARSLLWRSLGTQAKLEASIADVELVAGDQIVLCTDGIHRCVASAEICDALVAGESACEAVARVFSLARLRGNLDNGTLIVGRDLLVPSTFPSSRSLRADSSLRSAFALFMLVCVAVVLGVMVYRASTFDPSAGTETYSGDHR
jgi:PPM family protein phosphatase